MARRTIKRTKRRKQTRRRTKGGKVVGVDFSKIVSIGFEFETSEASFIMFDPSNNEYVFEPKTESNERTYTIRDLIPNRDVYLQPDYGETVLHNVISPFISVYIFENIDAENGLDDVIDKMNTSLFRIEPIIKEDEEEIIDIVDGEKIVSNNDKQTGVLNLYIYKEQITRNNDKLIVNSINPPNCEYVVTFFTPGSDANQILKSFSTAIGLLQRHFEMKHTEAKIVHSMLDDEPLKKADDNVVLRNLRLYKINDELVAYNDERSNGYLLTYKDEDLSHLHFTPQVTIGVHAKDAIDTIRKILDNGIEDYNQKQLNIFKSAVSICESTKRTVGISIEQQVFMIFAVYIGMVIPNYAEYKKNPQHGQRYFKDFTAINFRHSFRDMIQSVNKGVFIHKLVEILNSAKADPAQPDQTIRNKTASIFVSKLAEIDVSKLVEGIDVSELADIDDIFKEITNYKTILPFNNNIILFEYRAFYKDILSLSDIHIQNNELPAMPLSEMKVLVDCVLSNPPKKRDMSDELESVFTNVLNAAKKTKKK